MSNLLDNLNKLPPTAFVQNKGPNGERRVPETDAPVVGLKRGETGYWPIYSASSADDLNAAEGVTPAQREAMYFGSICGFDVPGADPDRYDAHGKLLPLKN